MEAQEAVIAFKKTSNWKLSLNLFLLCLDPQHFSAQVKYGVRSSNFIWAPCAQLYYPATPRPPRIWAHICTRVLLVSQDRRHLFVSLYQYNFFLSSEEFEACEVRSEKPRVVAICDRPESHMFFTLTFRYKFIFTSSRYDLSRKLRKLYRYSTSSKLKSIEAVWKT